QSPQRSPVFVRSGTSVADVEPPPVPRMALPSRPPSSAGSDVAGQHAVVSSLAPSATGQFENARRVLGAHPALWMLLAPGLLAVTAIALLRATAVHHGAKLLQSASLSASASSNAPPAHSETPAEQIAR